MAPRGMATSLYEMETITMMNGLKENNNTRVAQWNFRKATPPSLPVGRFYEREININF